MRSRQGRVFETLRRVQRFLDANDELLGRINASGARRMFDEAVAQFADHMLNQKAGQVNSYGETGRLRALRETLREVHMQPIAAIARANGRSVPELASVRMPPRRITAARLIAAAGAMAQVASAHTELFVQYGLEPDFAERLIAAADDVSVSIDERAASRGRRVAGTMGLQTGETRARQLLRVLDSLVLPALARDERLLAEWQSARHVDEKPGVSQSGGEARSARRKRKTAEETSAGVASSETSAAGAAPDEGTALVGDAAPVEIPMAVAPADTAPPEIAMAAHPADRAPAELPRGAKPADAPPIDTTSIDVRPVAMPSTAVSPGSANEPAAASTPHPAY